MLACCVAVLLASAEVKYAKPGLLIEPAELLKSPEDFKVLDVRSKKAFADDSVRGALHVDIAAWSKAFAANEGREAWVEKDCC